MACAYCLHEYADITAIDFNIGIPTPSGHIVIGVGEYNKFFDFNNG